MVYAYTDAMLRIKALQKMCALGVNENMRNLGFVGASACMVLFAGVLFGCRPPGVLRELEEKQALAKGSTPPITSQTETKLLLTNGMFGWRFDRTGLCKISDLRNGDFLRADYYDLAGEEKILPATNPLACDLIVNGEPLTSPETTDYEQVRIENVTAFRTRWSQDANGDRCWVDVETFFSPNERLIVQQIILTTSTPQDVQIRYWNPAAPTLGKKGSDINDLGDEGKIRISWELTTDQAVAWTRDGENATTTIKSPQKDSIIFTRSIRIGNSRRISEMMKLAGRPVGAEANIDVPSETLTAAQLIKQIYVRSNNRRFTIAIKPGDFDSRISEADLASNLEAHSYDEIAIESMISSLFEGIHPSNRMGVAPFGVSNTTYNGHIFWDADVWLVPILSFISPDRAKVIGNYRLELAAAAESNFQKGSSWSRTKPTKPLSGVDAAQYPWESSVSGREVSPTETRQQHHISGSVMLGLEHLASLGILQKTEVDKVGKKVANFYRWRADQFQAGEKELLTINDTISPDEFHFGDHDLYTNTLAEYVIRRWGGDASVQFYRPKSSEGYPKNYEADRGKGYKQAAGLLAVFPVQDEQVEDFALAMLDAYAGKSTPNGPAMTGAIEALLYARNGLPDRALEIWRQSWIEYTRHPELLFSEKKKREETYFLTGAGGCLQTLIYGFFGFRIDLEKQVGALWSRQLSDGKWLSIRPRLPKIWNSVEIRNCWIQGKKYNIELSNKQVRVTTGEK